MMERENLSEKEEENNLENTKADNTEIKEPQVTNEYLDKLTLELFMNKNNYKKYVSQYNPELNNKLREHYDSIRKYKTRILNLTRELLDDNSLQITTDVNETFNDFVRCLISHFKMKEIENQESFEKDPDILFGNVDNNEYREDNENAEEQENTEEQEQPPEMNNTQHNIWGGQQVFKKNI